ncbi:MULTISPECIES: hypothetical protein [Commensalibacter]|uniref:Uncharacterized protein n=2 Tax=Commensalibacter TaxID=1079922 RepID=W7DR82_9PROT|nr:MULTISPECIES: hypothetical protein [Commensalibacter]EUK17415.1 hypothetical protein COMX_10365 [Commensalibacter papalotli (ex Servin-Garciduenas et al. 2014)]CAI3957267.1 unnamed protein product [Commensalibacter papalotli (ex Botero et al. 2024)]CAI3957984.1 unnamed protein product [Commensalibacter papalotli (ex Botero et al. 2024)]
MNTKLGKKITIGAKPIHKSTLASTADAWVENRVEEEPMKRLTIDIPLSLHTAIKTSCASRGTKIADEMREFLSEKYKNN